MPRTGHRDTLLDLAHQRDIFRTKDATKRGIPAIYLTRMVRAGELKRLDRGLYALPNADLSEHASLAEVAARVPNGVICLISALAYHQLGTQLPSAVWLALPAYSKAPRIESPRLEIVRMGGESLEVGAEPHFIDGVTVRITDPSKTVADLFKFRSRVGLDVALEGLREYWHSPYRDLEALRAYTAIDRVGNVMRPYLEMLAA